MLFLANLVFGLIFAAASWLWLSMALGESLATRTLLTNLDLDVFVDLFVYHSGSLRMLLIGGVALAVVFALLGVWSSAVTVAAVAEDFTLSGSLRRGLELYPKYFGLWLLANAFNAASIAAAFFVGRALTRWTVESPVEATFYWSFAAGVLVGALLLLFFATVHDHARIHCALVGTGAARAYAWALGFVTREWRAVPLAVLLFATGFVAWVVYQTVGMLIATDSASRVPLSLVWGETLLLCRMLIRVWSFAAGTELQNVSVDTLS